MAPHPDTKKANPDKTNPAITRCTTRISIAKLDHYFEITVIYHYQCGNVWLRPFWVGITRSLYWKAAVQVEHRVNGSNQRDTGHWIRSAPPAAMAELQTDW
jgi:hypothetical protein